MLAYIWMESQSLILPVRPVCPEGPGLACGAAGPCKQSQSIVLCHIPSLLCGKH